jgi:hypothetical protein
VLASQQFQSIWVSQIRNLHAAFVTAMTTNESKVQQASKVALDISPQLLTAINQLDAKGIHQLDFARPYLEGDKHLLVTLAQGKQFKAVQGYFHLATTLRWVLWVATLLLAIAAVLLDTRRRRSGFWLAVAVACSCIVMLGLLAVGKQYATSHAPTPPAVADAIFSTLTSWLRWELRVLVIIGLLAALVLWVTGPTKHARGLRGLFAKGGGKATHAMEGAIGEDATARIEADGTTVVDWVASYATVLAWFGVVVGAIVLVVWEASFIGAILTILVTIAWFAAIMAIRRRVRASTEGDEPPVIPNQPPSAVTAGSTQGGEPPASGS